MDLTLRDSNELARAFGLPCGLRKAARGCVAVYHRDKLWGES